MSEDDDNVLRRLRDDLKTHIPDVETLVFHLSSTLHALSLQPTSVVPTKINLEILKSTTRYLPAIQISLLTSIIPTFLHALDDAQVQLMYSFLCPPKYSTPYQLSLSRTIALTSYLTLPSLIFSSKQGPTLPEQSRLFLLSTLVKLKDDYGIKEIYWAIWSTSSGDSRQDSMKILQWTEAVSSVIGLSAKASNAVGRWRAEKWNGDIPPGLIPRSVRTASKLQINTVLTGPPNVDHISTD